jgi:hypothetical protein
MASNVSVRSPVTVLLIACALFESIAAITLTKSAFVESSDHSKSFSGKFVIYDDFDRQMVESSVEPMHSIGPVAFVLAPPPSKSPSSASSSVTSSVSSPFKLTSINNLIKKQSNAFTTGDSNQGDASIEPMKSLDTKMTAVSVANTAHHHHRSSSDGPEVKALPSDNSHITWNDDRPIDESHVPSKPVTTQRAKQVQQDNLSNLLINLPPPTGSTSGDASLARPPSSKARGSATSAGKLEQNTKVKV